jgi:hypothetical protein
MFNAWSVRLPSPGPCTADHNLSGMASSLGCRPPQCEAWAGLFWSGKQCRNRVRPIRATSSATLSDAKTKAARLGSLITSLPMSRYNSPIATESCQRLHCGRHNPESVPIGPGEAVGQGCGAQCVGPTRKLEGPYLSPGWKWRHGCSWTDHLVSLQGQSLLEVDWLFGKTRRYDRGCCDVLTGLWGV